MKMLKTREEIAMAMNFRKYPVLHIDLADADCYGLKGCKVRIEAGTMSNGLPRTVHATLRVFRDEKTPTFQSGCTCLSSSFTYSDYAEMVEYAQAPLIAADQDVVIAIYDSRTKAAYNPILVHTGNKVSPHCVTPLTIERVDMTHYLLAAGIKLN